MLAFAMLMPAMMLTTACSSDDSITNTPEKTENTTGKVYEIPITINATRQDTDATRAEYNPSTNKLEFTTGDQLFVSGSHDDAGDFSGTLNWDGGTAFSGTIRTENPYQGTAIQLLNSASDCSATLLPKGYTNYSYLTKYKKNPDDPNSIELVTTDVTSAFTTSKTTAIEQFSLETATWKSYDADHGLFALAPENAILNFTITGLTPNSTSTTVSFHYPKVNSDIWINKTVQTDNTGTATFAIGIYLRYALYEHLENFSLSVDGKNITLVTETLKAGHIYNITRSVAGGGDEAYTMAASATGEDVGKLICTDGHIHAYGADPECTATRVALIAYVGAESNCTHGLAIALEDVSNEGLTWELTGINNDDKTAAEWCSAWNTSSKAVTGYTWRLPSQEDWQYMFIGCGSGESYANPSDWLERSYNDLATNLDNVDGTALHNNNDLYWSSTTRYSGQAAWCVMFNNNGAFFISDAVNQGFSHYVRPCLAF